MVAEINRGVPHFLDDPLAQIPAKLGPKSGFWQPTSQTQVMCQI